MSRVSPATVGAEWLRCRGRVTYSFVPYPCRPWSVPASHGAEEASVAWFRRGSTSGGAAPPGVRADFAHLEHFVQTRRGRRGIPRAQDHCYRDHGRADRRTTANGPGGGCPSLEAARAWGNRVGIPVYDVALVGYPQADARVQRAPQALNDLTALASGRVRWRRLASARGDLGAMVRVTPHRPRDAVRHGVSRWWRCPRSGRAAGAPGRRCRPSRGSPSARPSGTPGRRCRCAPRPGPR